MFPSSTELAFLIACSISYLSCWCLNFRVSSLGLVSLYPENCLWKLCLLPLLPRDVLCRFECMVLFSDAWKVFEYSGSTWSSLLVFLLVLSSFRALSRSSMLWGPLLTILVTLFLRPAELSATEARLCSSDYLLPANDFTDIFWFDCLLVR